MGDGGGSPAVAAPAAGDQCKVMWDRGGLKDKQTCAEINEYSYGSGDSKINLKLTASRGGWFQQPAFYGLATSSGQLAARSIWMKPLKVQVCLPTTVNFLLPAMSWKSRTVRMHILACFRYERLQHIPAFLCKYKHLLLADGNKQLTLIHFIQLKICIFYCTLSFGRWAEYTGPFKDVPAVIMNVFYDRICLEISI